VTTEQGRDDSEAVLERLGHLATRQFDGSSPAHEHAEARKRIRTALEEARGGHWLVRRQRWMWATSFACFAVAIAILFVGFHGPWQGLTYTVDPGASNEGGYVGVPEAGASAALHFSDGSEVRLAPGGKLHVGELHRDGARVALQDGTASLRVVHRGRTRWAVDAGPFVVEVTGTSFDVRWSGRDEVFDLALQTGSVIVRGPLTGEGLRLEAGQRLRVSLLDGRLKVEPMLPGLRTAEERIGSTAPSAAGPEGDALRPDHDQRATPEPISTKSNSSAMEGPRPTWSKRIVGGDYAGVLAESQAGGLEATLAQRPLADLVALSDAARYLERSEVAKKALLAQRSRFPASPDAKAAAFLLGRMSQDGGDARTAITWFTRYLAEAPGGPFAAEALGRKLVAVRNVEGIERAKPLAREYLERFPTGAHAAVAGEIARAR
jgi:TolA-binding protein